MLTMNNEKLIAFVQERRALWDPNSKDYHNRTVIKMLWQEIGTQMNQSSSTVKSKWRGLRDTYRRELAKLSKGTSVKSKWACMDKMLFLKDILTATCSKGNNTHSVANGDLNDDDEPITDGKMADKSVSATFQEQVSDSIRLPAIQKRSSEVTVIPEGKRQKNDIRKRLSANEERKCHNSAQLMEDSDYHFLMSLLPYMSNLTPSRNMRVRLQIQQIFVDEEKSQSTSEASVFNCRSSPST